MSDRPLILASGSKRRRVLFKTLDIPFEVVSPVVDERLDAFSSPEENAMRLAYEKAESVFRKHPGSRVLGCDTIVAVGDEMLGKPENDDDAKRMLNMLSGRTHAVITGCALLSPHEEHIFFRKADVTFFPLTEEEIDAYVKTKEPFGKAGAYALQERAGAFIDTVNGDVFAVIGLPIGKIRECLRNPLK